MKKFIIALSFLLGMGLAGISQPNPGSDISGSTGGSNLGGGGAPIDGGISVLLVLGAALAGKKVYKFQKNEI